MIVIGRERLIMDMSDAELTARLRDMYQQGELELDRTVRRGRWVALAGAVVLVLFMCSLAVWLMSMAPASGIRP